MALGRLSGAKYAKRVTGNAVMYLEGVSSKHMIDKRTSNTNSVFEVKRTQLESTGTAAAGLGVRESVFIENASGNAAECSRIDTVLVTATDAAEDSRIDFYVNSGGTVSRVFRIGKDGPVFDQGAIDLSAEASVISMKDNTDLALTVKEGSNVYMEFDTQNNAEGIVIGPAAAIGTAAFTVALQGRVTTTDGVTSGTARVVGGLAARAVAASTAITNTTTETTFSTGTYTIPADTLKAGSQIRVKWQGIATAAANTDTLQIKAYIGSTVIATGTATDISANAAFWGDALISVRTAGAAGTLVASSCHNKVPAASLTATPVYELLAETAVNTTTTQIIAIKATWSNADTGDSCRLDQFAVWID